MAMILWGTLDAASDVTMAAVTRTESSDFRSALSDLIAAILAGNAVVIEAAEQAARDAVDEALLDAGIVRFTDVGVPKANRIGASAEFVLREYDSARNISRAIRTDGTQYLPKAEVDRLNLGESSIRKAVSGSGYTFLTRSIDGEMGELAQDDNGMVPDWVLARWANRMGVSGDGLAGGYDIVIVAGQSNAAKSYRLVQEGYRETDPAISEWDGSNIVTAPAREVNLGTEFARAYIKRTAPTGRKVLLVQAAVGSSGFTVTSLDPAPEGYTSVPSSGTWDRTLTSDPKNLCTDMITAVQGAVSAAGVTGRVVAMLWSQGESDGSLTEAGYAAKLDDLIAQTRTDLDLPDLPVIIGGMVPERVETSPSLPKIARALADTPRRVARTGFVWGPTGHARMGEIIHLAFQGQTERSARMATAGLDEALLNKSDVEPIPPSALRARRVGGTAVIEWDRPTCRVATLTIESSTDGGTTWDSVTVDPEHGSRSLPVTVAPATTLTVRGTTTNALGTSEPLQITG